MNTKINVYLTLILIVLTVLSCINSDKTQKPNIIIINIDDMGWRDVGFMGTEYYETPNIDDLARRGMVFTNAYAAATNCAPSRACLMTGKWTPRHGIYTVGSSERGKSEYRKLIPAENRITLSKEHPVIPEILKGNGYYTCHAGKWHLSDDPTDYGFDVNIGGGHNGHPRSYYPPYGNVSLDSKDDYLTDLIMQKTIDFVDSTQQPFFLYYAPYAVHTPIHPVDSLLNKYKNKPSWNGQNNAAYATMVDNLDRNIGLLISALLKQNFLKNTVIVFTSDNGGLYGITKQLPLRAGKGSYYEGGIREPFFVVWDKKIGANVRTDVPVTNLDLFPTLLEVAGVNANEYEFDGNSLWPILRGETTEMERPLYWHFPIYLQAYNPSDNQNRDSLFRTRPGSVIRYGEWKLHQYFEDDGLELYNLKNDISETNNLVTENPEKTEELLQLLNAWRNRTKAPVPSELNPEYAFDDHEKKIDEN